MANSLKNIVKATKNVINAATATVAVSSEILADTTGLLTDAVSATPTVSKSLLESPFAAAKGYLMEADGLSAEQAEAAAYKYIRQDAAITVSQGAEAVGSFLADMIKDDETITNSDKQG